MGVLACDRNGCEHIMCDRYSVKYGYICNYCFDELVSKGLKQDIQKFMDSEKHENDFADATPEDVFGKIFELRND